MSDTWSFSASRVGPIQVDSVQSSNFFMIHWCLFGVIGTSCAQVPEKTPRPGKARMAKIRPIFCTEIYAFRPFGKGYPGIVDKVSEKK